MTPIRRHILFLLASLICLGSCKKNFETINAPWKDPTTASVPELFNGLISSLPLTAGEQSVFNAWLYPITQQAMITSGSYPYNNANTAAWNNYYGALANYRLMQSLISASKDSSSMT